MEQGDPDQFKPLSSTKSSSHERLQPPAPIIQITPVQNEPPAPLPPKSALKTKDFPFMPRRLSKLFSPMNRDELVKETLKPKDDESLGLLSGSTRDLRETLKVPFLKRRKSEDLGRLSRSNSLNGPLDKADAFKDLEQGTPTRDETPPPSPPESSESESEEEDDDDDEDDDNKDYTSWDDTICSNRSAYFKLYYQRNLAALSSNSKGEDQKSRQSTRASSYTSLASLIREKNKMQASAKDKKMRREEIGLMLLVTFLFLILVIGISLIYHFYHLHLKELALFKRLQFNEEERLLELVSDTSLPNQEKIVLSKLGLTLPKYSNPEDCTIYLKFLIEKQREEREESDLQKEINIAANVTIDSRENFDEFQFDDETVCLDWANQARVQIHKTPSRGTVNCYNVYWSAHHPGALKDCVIISGGDPQNMGVWWGIGELSGGAFPLKNAKITPSMYETQRLSTGKWGQILRRSFISSLGGIVTLPNHLPAIISVENSSRLCISVNASQQLDPDYHTTLNYTICSSPNISASLDYLHHLAAGGIYNPLTKEKIELPPLPHDEDRIKRIVSRIESPLYVPYLEPDNPILTQESVLKYVKKVSKVEIGKNKTILLPYSWQSTLGEYIFDPIRFPDPHDMIKRLKELGFTVALTLTPVVSTQTDIFNNGTREGLWVQQRDSSLPILLSYENVVAGGLVDFTNPRSSEWFVDKIQSLKDEYGIEDYHLALPDSNIIPRYHQYQKGIPNSDIAIDPYVKSVYSIYPPLSTEAAIIPPAPPTFVMIGNEDSGWESLSSMIPRILTLSLLGYPLIDAGIVGGKPNRPGNIPDDELFIRWVEAVAFLPTFQINSLPEFLNAETQSIVSNFIKKREELAIPRFKRTIKNIFLNSTPLIFPLGLLFPKDPIAASIGDEWIIGHDLLIAPILERGQRMRDIYIPEGIWESQSDKSLKQGPDWIYSYRVPLTDIAYFIRKKVI